MIFHIFTCMFINLIFADLDECNTNTHNCDVNADCVNAVGSYSCMCKAGYTGDGQSCNGKKQTHELKIILPPAPPPKPPPLIPPRPAPKSAPPLLLSPPLPPPLPLPVH